jgi:hypothetical protein
MLEFGKNPFILPLANELSSYIHNVGNRTSDKESIISVLKRESHNFFQEHLTTKRTVRGISRGSTSRGSSSRGACRPGPPPPGHVTSPPAPTPLLARSRRALTLPPPAITAPAQSSPALAAFRKGAYEIYLQNYIILLLFKNFIWSKRQFLHYFFMEQHSARTTVLLKSKCK